MSIDFLFLFIGLGLLVGGGDLMVRGASSLALRLGVSPLAIGLTVVAFGTSAPELAVNVTAAWLGNGEMSFGNIFGSNMANIGLIVAITALVRPLEIKSLIIRREVPMMILATAVAAAVGLDALHEDRESMFDRGDGLALLMLFTVFIYYTVNDVIEQRARARAGHVVMEEETEALAVSPRPSSIVISLALSVTGIVGLVFGAQLTVDAAVGLARAFGVSEAIIGLTVVAVGTSLPELSASLVATWKGATDLAIGNVVGSNIFNLLLVLGASAAIRPIPIPPGGISDVVVVGVLSTLLWLTSASAGRKIIRAEAGFLLAVYVAYVSQRALQ